MGKQAPASSSAAIEKAATTALAAAGDYGDFAGAGFENQTSDDVAIPFLGVLQALSPETQPGEKKVKGAESGMLINTVTKELFDGATGIIFQPADTKHVFVEWKPRNQGGGLVAVHQIDSPVVAKAKAECEFGAFKTPAGNDLIETYYVTGVMHRSEDLAEVAASVPEPMIIAFTSTKIKAYKQIMTRLRTVKGNPPLFAHRLRVTTFQDKNAEGPFSNITVKPLVENDVVKSLIPAKLGDQPHPVLVAGMELLKASRGNELKVDLSKQGGATAGGGKGTGADIPF